jgi:predicted nuclease of predicted toxin-antitoxin system
MEEAGHDVTWVGEWEFDPGDDEVLARAYSERRVLVTLDKDFGELVVVQDRPHAGIIRLVGFTAGEQGPMCVRVLALYASVLDEGALLTVGQRRVRIREAFRNS